MATSLPGAKLFDNKDSDSAARALGLVVPGGYGTAALLRPGQTGQIVPAVAVLVDQDLVGQGIFLTARDKLTAHNLARKSWM